VVFVAESGVCGFEASEDKIYHGDTEARREEGGKAAEEVKAG
jgi:hypothetical protein